MLRRTTVLLLLSAVTAAAQVRVSYFEGEVSIDRETLTVNRGQLIAEGTRLSTANGRLEMALGPDVYLRLGNRSSAQLGLGGTIELLQGSAIVDTVRANEGFVPVQLRVAGSTAVIAAPGEYEFRATPPLVRIDRGELQLLRPDGTKTLLPHSATAVPLGPATANETDPDTLLGIWSTNRRIRLASTLSGNTTPEQPLPGKDTGVGATVGLLGLAWSLQPFYVPLRPYRPGSAFFGGFTGGYTQTLPTPFTQPHPYRQGHLQSPYQPPMPALGHGATFAPAPGPHIPGPVIGH